MMTTMMMRSSDWNDGEDETKARQRWAPRKDRSRPPSLRRMMVMAMAMAMATAIR
jgi:hypothetical protein